MAKVLRIDSQLVPIQIASCYINISNSNLFLKQKMKVRMT